MIEFKQVPEIEVGILTADEICFTLNSVFVTEVHGMINGTWKASLRKGKIILDSKEKTLSLNGPVLAAPGNNKESSFTVHSVVIGVGFHWERREDQVFRGKVKIIKDGEKLTLVNVLSVEEYLVSVISSEMSSSSSPALLRAHAVISRGWLLAQIDKRRSLQQDERNYTTTFRNEDELIKWYDREDHKDYDVCADDHCQRYQGITRAGSLAVEEAVNQTYGEVLVHNGVICDTRFYKCCGGKTELFENTWEDKLHPYMPSVIDLNGPGALQNPDLMDEDSARKWIDGNPAAFCNTNDKAILSQVLNDYDQETNDFFRWTVRYSQKELSEIVKNRSGIDFGEITDLIPLTRGESGRISRLRIEGTKKTMIIGKELEIRKSLSLSHLYSSCFYVQKDKTGEEPFFILKGAGWGHGVGLCQIGAAVMGARGYGYKEILLHYFRGAGLKKLYS